jgi:hypothetical protein
MNALEAFDVMDAQFQQLEIGEVKLLYISDIETYVSKVTTNRFIAVVKDRRFKDFIFIGDSYDIIHEIGGLHNYITDIISAIEASTLRKNANNYKTFLSAYERLQDFIEAGDMETIKINMEN